MTRIIAGLAGGRVLKVPKRGTRPTSDRVRESLFGYLEAHLDGFAGLAVLDLYAGSGALGLEAISRGAGRSLLVESDRQAAAVARANATAVTGCEPALALGKPAASPSQDDRQGQAGDIGQVSLLLGRVERVIRGPLPGEPFDLVFIDPPYDLPATALDRVLGQLAQVGHLAAGAMVLVERATQAPAPTWPRGWMALDRRGYGETTIHFAASSEPAG
ncbi:MAG: RsmD family RNA methyltransferase [Micrococcales bacterium]|nr:RsmD family RNA methyltransferase [Micrococcales bacterium]